MSKQTAVDYLFEKLCGENGYVDTYYMDVVNKIQVIYEQAKAMEREQRLQDFKEGFQTAVDSLQAANNSVQSRKIKGGEQ